MSEIRVDTISEKTSANGVAVDGVTLKDGGLTTTAAVGIGTASPSKLLSLKSDGSGGAIGIDIHNEGTNSADDALITFETQGHRNYSMGIDRSASAFVIMSEADGLGTPRLTVDDNGNLGIGTTSPINTSNYAGLSLSSTTGGIIDILDDGTQKVRIVGSGAEASIQFAAGNFNVVSGLSGGSTVFKADSTGAVTMPLQPAFSVKPSSNQTNIGNNDTIAFGTEIFDQNADFASNTFTAPVAGRYQFNFMIRFDDIPENLGYAMVDIVSSNREYFTWLSPGTSDEAIGLYSFAGSFLVDMDANDTARVDYQEGDGGTTGQADVSANNSYFSGYLVC